MNAILGKGVPAKDLGNEGDYYIDTLTNFAYGPKTGAGWGEKKPLASILENDAQATFVSAITQRDAAPIPDTANDIEPTPLQKLEAKIAELESDTDELCKAANAAALTVLRQQRDELIAAAEAAAAQVKGVVAAEEEAVEKGVEVAEEKVESFWQKNKNDIINYTKTALLAVIAGKLLGVL